MPAVKCNTALELLHCVMLAVIVILCLAELIIGHFTHTLTLIMNSYCTFCNALEMLSWTFARNQWTSASNVQSITVWTTNALPVAVDTKKLKNTFGWSRHHTILQLIRYVILASSSLTVVLDALEDLVKERALHNTRIDYPFLPLYVAVVVILLNICRNFAINGNVSAVATDDISQQKRTVKNIACDFIGCVFVIVVTLVTYFTDVNRAFVDAPLAMSLACLLLFLNLSSVKNSCAILLQRIPDAMNLDALKTQLLQRFPDIIDVHEPHVWQLTATKIISTVHITFKTPSVYPRVTEKLVQFFEKLGISEITIQPEFFTNNRSAVTACLIECQSTLCEENSCCPKPLPQVLFRKAIAKYSAKELMVESSPINIKSIRVLTTQ